MPTFDLNKEVLGYRASEVPAVDISDVTSWLQPLTFQNEERRISPIPAHPDHYMRWVGSQRGYSEDWDRLATAWRHDIEAGNRHFAALERAGIQVPSQRHAGICSLSPYTLSLLYTVVPKYNDLTKLDYKNPDHVPAIVDFTEKMAAYTKEVAATDEPTFLSDWYGIKQASITSDGDLLLHDTELRLTPATPMTEEQCHPMRHTLGGLVLCTELDLHKLERVEEATRIRESTQDVVCGHTASLRSNAFPFLVS